MLQIDFIVSKLQKTIDSFNEYNNRLGRSKYWYKLERMSIDKLNNGEEIDEEWIELATLLEDEILPLESCIFISKYINKNSLEVDNYNLNNKIIDILYSKLHFNLQGNILINYIKELSTSNNLDKRKVSLLIRKFNKLKHVKLDYNVDSLVGVKINNFNKTEVINYIPYLDNYLYIIDEDIRFFDFYSGDEICTYKKEKLLLDKDLKSCSLISYNPDIQNMSINLNNDYERMLVYEVVQEICEQKVVLRQNNNLYELILNNINLFSDYYRKKIYSVVDYNVKYNINRAVEILRDKPNNTTLKELIIKSHNTEEIFTIIKLAESLFDKISLDNYVDAIYKCYHLERDNTLNKGNKRAIALFCEELIASKPIIFTEVIDILKEMYNENIFTDKTLDTLKYLRHTINDEQVIDEIILQCKYSNNKFDNEFVETICTMENESQLSNSNTIDKMLNRFIYNVDDFSQYDNRIIGCIYRFYKRNNDINALHKLCEYAYNNNLDIKSLSINYKDIQGLIKMYNKTSKELSIDFRLKLVNEFNDNEKILKYGKTLMESVYNQEDTNSIHIINEKYSELFKRLRRSSIILFEAYIKILESNYDNLIIHHDGNKLDKDDIDEIIFILNKKNVLKTTKVYILKVLINYFISESNFEEMLNYIQIYINKYSDVDEGKLFKSIIYNYSDNIEFAEKLLYNIDFNSINNAEMFLKIIADNLYTAQKLNLIPEILRYFVDNKKYEQSIDILKKYISKNYKVGKIIKNNDIEIDAIIYGMIIEPILSNIDISSKKEIYELLVERDDLTLKIREKYFYLHPTQANKNYLIKGFLENKIDSLKVKEFAANEYFQDDKIFCKIINTGITSNDNICDLVYKKAKQYFKSNKEYVHNLLKNIYKKESRLSELFKYCESYNNKYFDLNEREIFSEYKCIKREKGYGKCADKLYLKNIFDENDELEGIVFIDEENVLQDIIKRYFNDIGVKYTLIDEVVILIDEKQDIEFLSKEDNIYKFIDNFKLLINLQLDLIKNNKLMIEFFEESIIINEKGFIPHSFVYLCNYEEEFRIKNTSMFKSIPEISVGNYTQINEENICILMRQFIKRYLIKINGNYSINSIIKKFIDNILDNNDINTYDKLKLELEIFLEDESKAFEDITYKAKLERFDELEECEKLFVMEEIISRKDTTLSAKKIVIYYSHMIFNIESYILYLIDCFNNSNFDLEDRDFIQIYETINNNISNLNHDMINSMKNELFNFYINAKEICKIYSEDLKCDIDKLNMEIEDKEYLLSRV